MPRRRPPSLWALQRGKCAISASAAKEAKHSRDYNASVYTGREGPGEAAPAPISMPLATASLISTPSSKRGDLGVAANNLGSLAKLGCLHSTFVR